MLGLMSEQEQRRTADRETPGTEPMNPGDEVPPGTPGAGENLCPDCSGRGRLKNGEQCPTCGGTGRVMQAVSGGG